MCGNAGITVSTGCYRGAACLIARLPWWIVCLILSVCALETLGDRHESLTTTHGQKSMQPQTEPVIYSPSLQPVYPFLQL